jgi:outer membrane receptor protein involved in Fe transport
MRTFQVLGTLLLAVIVTPSKALAQTTGALTGVVLERGTGQPIAAAEIRVDTTTLVTSTNAIGRFHLEGVPVGRASLVIHAQGFLDVRLTDVLVSAATATPVSAELVATPNFLDRVQVTATKEPVSVGTLAGSVDVIDSSTIESRGDRTLTQAIAHVPGAIISTQLGIFESVMLRGLPRGDPEFTNTLLLVDGVPQTTSTNGARVVGLTINDASDIEVARGPNSALYGRTAIGGSVNVRTADPTPVSRVDVDLTGGQFGTLKGVAKASGPLGSRAGYYASIGQERNTGFFDTKTADDFSVGNLSAFGKLTFVPDSQSVGSISVNRVVSDNSTPTNEPIVEGQLLHVIDPRFDRLTNFNIPGPNYHQGESRLTLNYTRQLMPSVKLVEVFGYRSVAQHFIEDGDFIGSPFDLRTHTIEQYPFSQNLDEHIVYQEFRAEMATPVGKPNLLIVGGSYERTSGSIAADFIFTDPDNEGFPIDYLNPVIPPRSEWQHDVQPTRDYRLGITGLFAQYRIEPTNRWVLTGGGRYDRLALENTPEGSSQLEAAFDAFSPKLSATYKLLGAENAGQTVNVYGAYSHAFLPPRRPSSLTPANVDLNLQPEDIDNLEGGVKSGLLNGRVLLEATYFWMREDGVVLSRRQGPFFFPTNAGQQRYKGLETAIGATISPTVSIYANAAWYRSRFGEFVIETEDGDEVLTGNRLPISPSYVVNWGASVRPRPDLEAVLNVKHVSAVQTDRENTFALNPYSLVDAAVTWRHDRLRITLSARNLLDRAYYWNGDGETADPGQPRQVVLSASIRVK